MAYTFNEIFGSVALLISCGAAVLLVKLLLSNTVQQEKFFNSLGRCNAELQNSSKNLETLCAILDRRFSNMEENSKQTDPLLINTLQRFDKVSKEIHERLDEMFITNTLGGNDKPPSDMPSEAVVNEISKLQSSMAEIANQLRKSNYLSMDENAELGAMRKRIESYQSMVMKARSEAKDSEAIMSELRLEIKQLQTAKKPNPSAEASAENQRLQEQLEDAEREKKVLEEKLKVLDNEMQRNNIEKKFIEDRFIELS